MLYIKANAHIEPGLGAIFQSDLHRMARAVHRESYALILGCFSWKKLMRLVRIDLGHIDFVNYTLGMRQV